MTAFAVSIAWIVNAATCPPLVELQRAYAEDGLAALQSKEVCHRERTPLDLEVARFLSDAYWWEGRTKESLNWARRASDDPFFDPLSQLGLHIQDRLYRWQMAAQGALLRSSNSWSHEQSLQLQYRVYKKNEIWLKASRTNRRFEGAAEWLRDESFELGGVWAGATPFYLVQSVKVSPSAELQPRVQVGMEPHWVFGGQWDLSLGTEWRAYTQAPNSFELQPGLLLSLGDHWQFGLKGRIGLRPDLNASLQKTLYTQWHPRWSSQLSLSFGRGVEGPELFDEFVAIGGDLGFRLHPQSSVFVGGGFHRGELRTESRANLRWEFRI